MNFKESLAVGQEWEHRMEAWMAEYFANTGWTINDTRNVYRDQHNNQYPDYELISSTTNRKCFIDAKKRNTYYVRGFECFGFDDTLYNSYTNIAKLHDTKVYVGFNDPKYDSKHVYILDMSQEPSFKLSFNNQYGNDIAYRWRLCDLLKIKL